MASYKKESTILAVVLISIEVIILFMYGFFVRIKNPGSEENINGYFPWMQNVSVMILIGFGYLMTFIKNYGWSSLGYTFLITAVGAQYYILWAGFWKMVFENHGAGHAIQIGLQQIIQALFCVGSCLISTGAIIGRTHPLDLIVMILCQIVPYALVEVIIFDVLKIHDAGGSMNIHLFGAYFGLAVSSILAKKHSYGDNLPSITRISGNFSMIGTFFLWIYWPSFNSGIIQSGLYYERQLAIINTFLSLTGSVIASFATSALFRQKFGIDQILNSTLAGGVISGSACNLITNPFGAISIGLFGGALSSIGFIKISAFLTKIGIYDTCGVNNLHGMPGFFGGVFSAIFLAAYNGGTQNIVGPVSWATNNYLQKGGMQMAGVGIALSIAIITGILTGFIILLVFKIQQSDFFNDSHIWQIQEQHQTHSQKQKPMKVMQITNLSLGTQNC